jgi:HEPN domain-containing protein
MDTQRVKRYWTDEAQEALKVAGHLFEKQDFSYALFFGHLALEKLLKALFVVKNKEQAPYIHNLLRLAESIKIPLTEKRKEQLLRITTFNLEARYPDEKRSFRNKCTEEFAAGELANIEEVFKWLELMLQ